MRNTLADKTASQLGYADGLAGRQKPEICFRRSQDWIDWYKSWKVGNAERIVRASQQRGLGPVKRMLTQRALERLDFGVEATSPPPPRLLHRKPVARATPAPWEERRQAYLERRPLV